MTTDRERRAVRNAEAIGADVDEEVRFHLDARAAELTSAGLSEPDAQAQALREFGDIEDTRRYVVRLELAAETTRQRRRYVTELFDDVVYALRRLAAAPAFAVTAILTLALGIGANAAIFSVVHGVVLQPLPFPDPDRLYAVYSANSGSGQLQSPLSPPDLDDWRAARRSIEELGGYFYAEGSSGVALLGRGSPKRLSAVFVEPGFFPVLGILPAHGRWPREDEMVRGGPDRVLVLGHAFWMREFGGDRAIVGTPVTLADGPYTVVGVMPATFRFPADAIDVYVPYSTIPDTSIPRKRFVRVLDVVARARPGTGQDAVRTEVNAVAGRLAQEHSSSWDAATVVPLADVITGPVRQGLWVLFGGVGLVLLMACVNIAGLQLARALGRSREMAVRLALGARRGRLLRQLLTESLVLSVIGGLAGIALAHALVAGLLALSAGQLPRAAEVSLDGTVVAFAFGLSLVAGLLFGVVPAWRTSRGSAQAALREGGRGVAGTGHRRLRIALVVAEIAVAMVLIVGAGLMGRSFLALTDVDLGFEPDGLVAVQFTIDSDRHASTPAGQAAAAEGARPYAGYYQQVIEAVRRLPGVASAAAVKDPPFRGNGERLEIRRANQVIAAGEPSPTATAIHVSEGYFATIGARVDGREFTPRDRAGAPFVLVVNEALARQHFPGERAVGKSVVVGNEPVEIVGVVNDIRQVAVAEPARPTLYIHNIQNTRVKTTIVARTDGDPARLAGPIREAIWAIDPLQPITSVFTFDQSVGRALARPRLLAVLLGAFGLLGLALGAVGVYGIVSAMADERRREIGVRLALGARPSNVLLMMVRRGLVLTVAGVAIGLAGAAGLSRFLASVLYGVEPLDAATFIAMATVLLVVAVAASTLPARRAAKLDPVETLRAE